MSVCIYDIQYGVDAVEGDLDGTIFIPVPKWRMFKRLMRKQIFFQPTWSLEVLYAATSSEDKHV
jgi:hypothetical protein